MSFARPAIPLALALAAAAGGAAAPRASLLDPSLEISREVDPRGLTLLQPERRRTPTGFLYPYPYEPPGWRALGAGLEGRGSLELGFLGDAGEADETRFREFSDTREGFLLRDFELDLRRSEGAGFASLSGGSAGREDQFYRAELGRYGSFRLEGSYASLEHRYANDARVLFTGAGSERLSLPAGLVPGGQTPAQLQAALAGIPESRIAVDRRDGQLGLQLTPDPTLHFSADYRRETREGGRPSGGALGFTFPPAAFGSLVETLDPISEVNHVWRAGAEIARERFQANLSYQGSAYENARRSLLWERPTTNRAPADPLFGRYALAPDNQWHNLRGDLALQLPLHGRFRSAFSWSRGRQDDELLAPTINPAIAGWTDPATALARQSADARVDLWMADAELALRPWRPLSLETGFHYFRRDSDTDYVALNPGNGFYGYVAEDGAAGLVRRYAAAPWNYARWKLEGSARYRPTGKLSAELEYAHQETQRENRARHVVRDDSARLSLVSRALPSATARVTYDYLHRSGSDYDPARDAIYYSQGPPGFDPPLAGAPGLSPPLSGSPLSALFGFRQFDLASQDRHQLEARLNFLLGDSTDLGFSGRFADLDYSATFGLQREKVGEFGLDTTWQPSPRFDLHAFGQSEWRLQELDSARNATGPAISVPGATSWEFETELWSFALGAGFRWQPTRRLTWKADYVHTRSRETQRNELGPLSAADSFPSQHGTDHALETSLAFQWIEPLGTALFYRFQRGTLEDLNQIGLAPNLGGNALYLGHVDDHYSAHLVGATLKLRF